MSRVNLQINHERREQLNQLARALGTHTITDTLGAMIRSFADQGLISGDIPGIRINALSDGIVIQMNDNEPTPFPWEVARSFMDALENTLAGTEITGVDHNVERPFTIHRRGNLALAISVPVNATPRVLTLDLARDLIRMIERAMPHENA